MDTDSSLSEPPSELNSPASLSTPFRYPSPSSSQDQDGADINASARKRKIAEGQQVPPAKKRKRAEPKQRTTERLDLTAEDRAQSAEQKAQLDLLLQVLRRRRKIVVVAGAGISVSAGIPDFRSVNGLFKTLKSEHKLKASGQHLFDASVYQNDKSTGAFHAMVRSLSGMVSTAKPTPFHQMLSTLGEEGRLLRLYTQNVDGIDVALPALETNVPLNRKGPWPRSVQLHGGLEKMVCSKCHALSTFEPDLFDGPVPPPCQKCEETDTIRTNHAGKRSHGVGRLRPRMVLYNEHNPDEEAIGACMGADLRARPDAIIVVGTSMKIPGVRRIVKEMCGVVRGRRDGIAIWINQDDPPPGLYFEDCWDLVVKGPCDEVARQWNMSMNPHIACSSSDIERARDETNVEVIVRQAAKARTIEMLTPAPSPRSQPSQKFFDPVKSDAAAESDTKGKAKTTSNRRNTKVIGTSKKSKTTKKKHLVVGESKSDSTISATFRVSKPGRAPSKLAKQSVATELVLKPMLATAAQKNNAGPRLPSPKEARVPTSVQSHGSQRQEKLRRDSLFSGQESSFNITCESMPTSGSDDEYRTPEQQPYLPRTPEAAVDHKPPMLQNRETISPKSIPRGMETIIS